MPQNFRVNRSVQRDAFPCTGTAVLPRRLESTPDVPQMARNIRSTLPGPISIAFASCIDYVVNTE